MISVIIPVFNEAATIHHLLEALSVYDDVEVIVVDGGSHDDTVEQVMAFPHVILTYTSKGRATQLNHGGFMANGDILFFLHADSVLPDGALQHIQYALADRAVIAGSFYLQFDRNNFWLNGYSRLSKINHQLLTFGDQGLFMRKDTFYQINGYKNLPIMEDFEIQQRLRKKGSFVKLDQPIVTSARRYVKHGFIWQQLKNTLLLTLFLVGISPHSLAKYYYK